jgi:SAM-dependent methyltransferase
MQNRSKRIAEIIIGMRAAYAAGENAMGWCRNNICSNAPGSCSNELLATLVAYDLQAGSYIDAARKNPEANRRWCAQLARLLERTMSEGDSILEVGSGEATTLAGVLSECTIKPSAALGFDISWSRVSEGRNWLSELDQHATLFVGDLLNMPLADNSIDVVYSSHSLEPNGSREEEAMRECLRVARRAVVLVEPIYELASSEAQARMREHGYVRGLRDTAARLGAKITDYRLLEYSPNPLNPSGVLCLNKNAPVFTRSSYAWRCPVTATNLCAGNEFYYAREAGLTYPVLRGVPMLRAEHAIIASKLCSDTPG